jgi:hypothetical protein
LASNDDASAGIPEPERAAALGARRMGACAGSVGDPHATAKSSALRLRYRTITDIFAEPTPADLARWLRRPALPVLT